MKLSVLVGTSAEVAGASRRLEKTAKLASLLKELNCDDVAVAIGFLTGWPRQGKIGVGWATVADAPHHNRRIAFASHVLADPSRWSEHSDPKAAQCQPIGSCQSRRSGAEHHHRLAAVQRHENFERSHTPPAMASR